MSSRPPVELDFLGLGTAESSTAAARTSPEFRRSSIRGMQSAIARIDPELLRRVIANKQPPPPPLPSLPPETAPLTVFYNGTVVVFDVSHDKAEAIMKMASEASTTEGLNHRNGIVGKLTSDLPLARTKSLQRFLAKRKERLTAVGPYEKDPGAAGPAKKKAVDVKKEISELI